MSEPSVRADDFATANRVFQLFTLAERMAALKKFSELRYPSIEDRFFEAVYSVVRVIHVK